MKPLFPLFLDLAGRPALLLGGGEAAVRRRRTLERAGASVRSVDRFTSEALDGCAVAIGADAPADELRAMHEAARARGIPVNCVDRPALSTFITPAVVERLPLQVAIASSGTAPVLARLLRARIEVLLDPAFGALAALADRLKAETRAALPDVVRRRRLLERVLGGRVAALMLAGEPDAAEAAFRAALIAATTEAEARPEPGLIHLVEPGPGPADLLTLRALRLLGEADVIVHAPEASPSVLDAARRDADRIARPGALPDLLLALGRAGRRVVRLGPHPGEADALRAGQVAIEYVPGVATAAPTIVTAAAEEPIAR